MRNVQIFAFAMIILINANNLFRIKLHSRISP
nr:MAG TPA: hypothetical protein [Caudoviricetes sp.]